MKSIYLPIILLSSPDKWYIVLVLDSFEVLGVLKVSVQWYSGSFTFSKAETNPQIVSNLWVDGRRVIEKNCIPGELSLNGLRSPNNCILTLTFNSPLIPCSVSYLKIFYSIYIWFYFILHWKPASIRWWVPRQ